MGEANRKKLVQRDLLTSEPRCIYCTQPAASLEHMPPITIFRGRQRPQGMVYASCEDCNNLTSAADLVASFLARLGQEVKGGDWQMLENLSQRFALRKKAPGFLDELFADGRARPVWLPRNGVLSRHVQYTASGPLTRGYLNVFCGKLGMALYREHVGEALPADGIVHTMWFANAGLSLDTMQTMLGILPASALLSQGAVNSGGQFSYRFNTDRKSIVAALAGFHHGLHAFVIATATPQAYPVPNDLVATQSSIAPGQLVASMP